MYRRGTASHHTEVPECVWAGVRAAPGDGESQSFAAEELDGAHDDAARPAPRSGGRSPDRGRSAKLKRTRLLCSSVRMPCSSSCTACVRLVSGPGWGDASWDHADRVLACDPVADGGGGATGASGSSSSTTTQASRVRSLSPSNLATTRARITSRPCGRGRCRTRSPGRKNPVAGSRSPAGFAGNSIS